MNAIVPVVGMKKEKLVVSSRVIANQLRKQHKHVLESIENIINKSTAEMSALFLNSKYKATNGKRNKEYLLTKDGFTLYMFNIQGYNDFKMAYINEFNRMERALNENRSGVESPKSCEDLPLVEKTYRGERVLFIKDIAGIYGISRYSLSAVASVNGIGKLLKGRELKKFKAENKDVDLFLVSNIKIINRNEFSILKRCVSFCCDNDLINDYYAADGVKDEMSLYDKFRLVDLAGDILNVARRKAGNTDYYKALNLIASKIYVDCGMLDKHTDDLSINSKVGWNLQQPLIDMRALVRSRLTK